jgi:hypothetical protein
MIAVLLLLTWCSVVNFLSTANILQHLLPEGPSSFEPSNHADRNNNSVVTFLSTATKNILVEEQNLLPEGPSSFEPSNHADRNNNTHISNGMIGQQDVEIFNVSSRDDNAAETPLTMPSYLQFEVDRIIHTPHEAKITVTSKDSNDRKCLKPRSMGRLSGQCLAVIQWNDANMKITQETDAHLTRQDAITGYYKVPSPGRYFIEILGLLCNNFPFDAQFRGICLEDATHNHLTAQNSFIDVTVTTANANELNFPATNAINKHPLGHWKWSDESAVPVPMKTRYQGQKCRGSTTEPRCTNSTSLDRFTPYRFE